MGDSKSAYQITAILGCLIGVIVGQFDVQYIISIAVPALMFIYPITIALILLNVLPETYGSKLVYRGVTTTVLFFSIPDFLQVFVAEEWVSQLKMFIPFSKYSLGWVFPSIAVFWLINISELFIKKRVER